MQAIRKWLRIWWLEYRMRGLRNRAKDLAAEMSALRTEIWMVEEEITKLRMQ